MSSNFFPKKKANKKFWDWFKNNSEHYFNFEQNQTVLFRNLKNALAQVNLNLVFEFSPILEDGKREFILSADGMKSIFPIVKALVNEAPQLNKWHIIAFRQPKEGYTQIEYDDLIINYDDVYFQYAKDSGQVAVKLSIRGYEETEKWGAAIFVLLDNLLGEYHTEMSLSYIEMNPLNEDEVNMLSPITDLPVAIANYFQELSN